MLTVIYTSHTVVREIFCELVFNCLNLLSKSRQIEAIASKTAHAPRVYSPAVMKAIRIIKRAQIRDAAQAAADESKKPVEPPARTIADTVKGWIAEAEQRKRSQRHSLAALGLLVLIAFTVAMGHQTRHASDKNSTPPNKVTITFEVEPR